MELIWLKITINIICSQFAVLMFAKIENRNEKKYHDYRLFQVMLITIIFLLVLHSISLLLNGSKDSLSRIVLRSSISLLFPASTFLAMTYAIYIEVTLNRTYRPKTFWIIPYIIPLIFIFIINIVSVFTEWLFKFDESGYYQPGNYIYIPIILSFCYVFAAIYKIIIKKKTMDKMEFSNLVTVPIPMIVAGSLQSFLQTYPILLPGCVLSLFLVFSNIQHRRLSFDHLTGAYNRQKLEEFLAYLSENSKTTGKPFSAMLADVNHFKNINDTFGHIEGDKALITVVELMRSGIRNVDFLARYAGDEFVIVFPDCDEKKMDKIISRIKHKFIEHSAKKTKYSLSISIGASVFNPLSDTKPENFIKKLDGIMYENKKDFHRNG